MKTKHRLLSHRVLSFRVLILAAAGICTLASCGGVKSACDNNVDALCALAEKCGWLTKKECKQGLRPLCDEKKLKEHEKQCKLGGGEIDRERADCSVLLKSARCDMRSLNEVASGELCHPVPRCVGGK